MWSSIARPVCQVSGKPNQTIPPYPLFLIPTVCEPLANLLCRAFSCPKVPSNCHVCVDLFPEVTQCDQGGSFQVLKQVSVSLTVSSESVFQYQSENWDFCKSWNGFENVASLALTVYEKTISWGFCSDYLGNFRPLSNEDRKGETIPFFTEKQD